MRRLWLAALAACGGGAPEDTGGGGGGGPTDGACGDVHTDQPVTVTGEVDYHGSGVDGAAVQLEERNWDPGRIYAETTTSPGGTFQVAAAITTVDDCWGLAVDYWIVASLGDATGETPINSFLFNAMEGTAGNPGDGVAELVVPIDLEGTVGTTTGGSGMP